MQSIVLSPCKLIFLFILCAISACDNNGDDEAAQIESNAVNRYITEIELEELEFRLIVEMCMSDSEYKPPELSRAECIEQYQLYSSNCRGEILEERNLRLSTEEYVAYARAYSECLDERLKKSRDLDD